MSPSPSPAHQPPPAARAADTTRENPWPLRRLTENIRIYVERMSTLWVEGQVVEYRPRSRTQTAFFTLRDTERDTSMTVTAPPQVVAELGPAFTEGVRVVTRVTPTFWERRGSLNLQASEIHLQGTGNLLARIEEVRARLAAEGLFSEARKVPIPFLPRRIGLVCGRNAKAKDDVMRNAALRWPAALFEVREVAVQGEYCVSQVSRAAAELDAIEDVDVIVIARGGGSVEDLLPFSDERMLRAVAEVRTPVVSAIGHEGDCPLLDLVADLRASTPTDAARRIVPDLASEQQGLAQATSALRGALHRRLATERESLALLTSRPVLLQPAAVVDGHRTALATDLDRLRRVVSRRLETERTTVERASATLTALSPRATLERGYSLLRLPDGRIVRSWDEVKRGDLLEALLAHGRMVTQVVGATSGEPTPDAQ